MIYGFFGLGALVYFISALVSYDPHLSLSMRVLNGLVLGAASHALWMIVAHISSTDTERYVRGWMWDSMLTGMFALIPLFLFGVSPTPKLLAGIILVTFGLFMMR